jgi:AcrR family transcriptional regulator
MSAADRRAAILDAAMEAFATSGYHGTSIDDIASAAAISKALIYEHFESKADLHATLIGQQADELFGRLRANASPDRPADERLRGGVDAFLGFVEERREAWRALFRDAADPEVAALVARVQARATAVVARLIAPGSNAAALDDAGPGVEIHAQMLSGAVQSLATWWHEHREVPREVLVDRAIQFCWHGVDREPEPEPARAVVAAPVSSPAR